MLLSCDTIAMRKDIARRRFGRSRCCEEGRTRKRVSQTQEMGCGRALLVSSRPYGASSNFYPLNPPLREVLLLILLLILLINFLLLWVSMSQS